MNSKGWRGLVSAVAPGCGKALLRGVLLAATVLDASISQSLAQSERSQSRLSLNTRIGFNIKAEFKNVGGIGQNNPGPATGGVDRFYDDGFNRVDISGNANGNTWFWGYQNASQLPGDDTVVMRSSSSTTTGAIRDVSGDPQLGAELSYFRVLGEDRAYRWGMEAALGWLDLRFNEDRTLTGAMTRTSDAYALRGIVPPLPPYAGTYEGPGPIIGATPTRTTLTNDVVTTGRYDLEARAYSLRLGLRYESSFNDRIALHFGGGFSGALLDSEFNFREVTSVSGIGSTMRAGTGSETDFVLGGYAGVGVTVHLTRRLSAFAGAQYEHLSGFSQQVGGKEANINFDHSVFVIAGLGFNL